MFKGLIKTMLLIIAVNVPMAVFASSSYSDNGKQQVSNTNWMSGIPNNIRINKLSLPGTHDTMTYTSNTPYVQTQALNLKEQLNSGIRALDIRVKLSGSAFAIHHGDIYLHKNFTDVLKDVTSFLANHRSEFIVMRISKAGKGGGYQAALKTYTDDYPGYFWKNNSSDAKNPTVGEVRGKIVVLRHDGWIPNHLGIEYPNKRNTQDWYNVDNIGKKYGKVKDLINKINNSKEPPVAINYLSGNHPPLNTPQRIAKTINKKVHSYINGSHKNQIGMMMMDFPGGKLINTIISYNRFYDMGYRTQRHMADINGDGRADYCRIVGQGKKQYYTCSLSTGSQLKYTYRLPGSGYNGTQQFVDIDGNGFDDFCREIGSRPSGIQASNKSWIQCVLFEKGSVNAEGLIIPKIKKLIKFHRLIQPNAQWLRQFIDVNGDGKADMCRGVKGGFKCYFYTGQKGLPFGGNNHEAFFKVDNYGSSEFRQLAVVYRGSPPFFCRKMKDNTISCSQLDIETRTLKRTLTLAYDAGYKDYKQIVDINDDGKSEYCREVGNRDSSHNKNRIECVRGKIITLTVPRESLGYRYFRRFADFTGDKQMEYVKAAGDAPNKVLAITEYKKVNGKLVPNKTINHHPGID